MRTCLEVMRAPLQWLTAPEILTIQGRWLRARRPLTMRLAVLRATESVGAPQRVAESLPFSREEEKKWLWKDCGQGISILRKFEKR